MMIIQKSAVIFSIAVIGFSQLGGAQFRTYPAPQNMVGFWPLDTKYGLASDGNGKALQSSNFNKVETEKTGPTGLKGSSYTVTKSNMDIGQTTVPFSPSFTVSFFVRTIASGTGGIFVFKNAVSKFGVVYNNKDMQIRRLESRQEQQQLITTKVFSPGVWTFVAIVGLSNKTIAVYDKNAAVLSSFNVDQLSSISNAVLQVGAGPQQDPSQDTVVGMTTSDGIACFSYFNVSLNRMDLLLLKAACGSTVTTPTAPTVAKSVDSKSSATTSERTTAKPQQISTTKGKKLSKANSTTEKLAKESSRDAKKLIDTSNRTLTVKENLSKTMLPNLARTDRSSELIEDVMKRCDHFDAHRWSPPPQFAEDPTAALPVTVGFEITALQSISNIDETITARSMLITKWSVNTCPWNSSTTLSDKYDFSLLRVMHNDNIWQPEISLVSNGAESVVYQVVNNFVAMVDAKRKKSGVSGYRSFQFFWTRDGPFTSRCILDLKKFPFDTQKCSFVFAVQRDTFLVKVQDPPIFIISDDAFHNTEWKLLGSGCNSSKGFLAGFLVSQVTFTIELERIPDYYIRNLFMPVCLLAGLCLVSFLIPPGDPNRAVLTVTILLALTVCQGQVLSEVPKKQSGTLLSTYVEQMLWFASACLVYSMFTLWVAMSIFGEDAGRKMPRCLKKKIGLIRCFDIIFFFVAFAGFAYGNYKFMVLRD